MLEVADDPTLYVPNPGGQQQFLDDYTHRYCALVGGWYAGKTWAGARKLVDQHLYNAFAGDCEGEPTYCSSLVIAPTYGLAQSINIPELQAVFREMNLSARFAGSATKYWFVLPDLGMRDNPSLIRVRSAEKPSLITGFSCGSVWGDEVARWKRGDPTEPTSDPILQADGRLRGGGAKVLQFNMTFTHEGDLTSVYELFEEKPTPDHAIYRAGTFDNPHARQAGEVWKRQLGGELANQYLDGNAAILRGKLIHDSFGERNLDERLALQPGLPLQIAIDFNINPGMHALIGQYLPGLDLLATTHELYGWGWSVIDLVQAFRRLVEEELGGWQWPRLEVYGDPAGRSRWAGTGETLYQRLQKELDSAGVPYELRILSAAPLVSDRAAAVNSACLNAVGETHYKVHPRCIGLKHDYRTQRWTKGEIDKSDKMVGHFSDADGYRVYYLMPVRRIDLGQGAVVMAN